MISGFSSAPRHHIGGYDSGKAGGLPIPFNLPGVLHNLLFEDVGLEFTNKQKDMLETLRFSQNSLVKLQQDYALKGQELVSKMIREPENASYKKEYDEMQLDMLDANQQFKELVIVISDLLTREQYAKLMEFSNIPL